MALVDTRTDDLELSLKLYHAQKLRLSHQQLMTEAPRIRGFGMAEFGSWGLGFCGRCGKAEFALRALALIVREGQ